MRLSVCLLVLMTGTATAAPDWQVVRAQSEAFARARVKDGRQLVMGPAPPAETYIPPALSCTELYERRVALMRTQYDYKPPYTDDPRNKAAVFIGTIFTPGFYFLPFSGIQRYLETLPDNAKQREIDQLRYASAQQTCFIR